jgi:hypothetical protein
MQRESYRTELEAQRNKERWEKLGYSVILDKSCAKIDKFTLKIKKK